jgi:hypothetical protein
MLRMTIKGAVIGSMQHEVNDDETRFNQLPLSEGQEHLDCPASWLCVYDTREGETRVYTRVRDDKRGPCHCPDVIQGRKMRMNG